MAGTGSEHEPPLHEHSSEQLTQEIEGYFRDDLEIERE